MTTIATKNGIPIIKDGSIATACGCCGGWYCYCEVAQCGLFELLGFNQNDCLTATISGISGSGQSSSYFIGFRKPGIALNGAMKLRYGPPSQTGLPFVSNFSFCNNGAGFYDRATGYDILNFYAANDTRFNTFQMVLMIRDKFPGMSGPAYGVHPITAVKELDPCSVSSKEQFSFTFRAADGDFGPLPLNIFPDSTLPENNFGVKYFGSGPYYYYPGAYNAEYHWYYNFRNAVVTLSYGGASCPEITDQRAWWFATPYGGDGSENQPPATIQVTLDQPTTATAERFAGTYTLERGVSYYIDAGGNLIQQQTGGSSYSVTVPKGGWVNNPSIPRYVTISAQPTFDFPMGFGDANAMAPYKWSVSCNEQPKVQGWYGGDGNGSTAALSWGANTSGTLTGTVNIAEYIGGGTLLFSITL